eukprot:m.206285 g.206285  ORF g.206285 m.206285 type:complete len:508 (-) comp23286_c0_seq1:153-1676(-)
MFAVLSVDDPPTPLIKRSTVSDNASSQCFFCSFNVDTDDLRHVAVFSTGAAKLPTQHTASVSLQLGPGVSKTLGQYDATTCAFSTPVDWTKAEKARVADMVASGGMVKLMVDVTAGEAMDTTPMESETSSASSVSKRRTGASAPTPPQSAVSKKRRKASSTATSLTTTPTLTPTSKEGKGKKASASAAAPAAGEAPSSRWGHSLTLISPTQALLVGGQGTSALSKDSMWHLDVASRSWSECDTVEKNALPTRTGHAAVTDCANGKVYVFGGAKYKRFFTDLHELDVATGEWGLVAPLSGKAPTCSYHSIALFRGEILVFGGVHPRPDPTPDVCSNELHVFNLAQRNWYQPPLNGTLPTPRSGHSATLIGDTLVIFGGWDQPHAIYNDVYTIDLTLMESAKLDVSGDVPSPRSWHAAVSLPCADKRLVLIHGGLDNDIVALGSAHVLDLDKQRWYDVSTLFSFAPRAGHTVVQSTEDQSLIFWGGGDNTDHFDDVNAVAVSDIVALCV